MSEWIFFMHPPRDDFRVTMTDDEVFAFGAHSDWMQGLVDDGSLILAGPCLGRENTGILIFEAEDEAAARRIIAKEPVTGAGHMRAELRPFQVTRRGLGVRA